MALESFTADERESSRKTTTLRQPAAQLESPVFADLSGRRARVFRLTGRALVVVLALWLAAVGAGLAGLGTLPGVPEIGGAKQSAPPENRSPGDTSPGADGEASVGREDPADGRGEAAVGGGSDRVETSSPAADSPARAPQRRREAAPVGGRRGTPPATRSPRSTPPARPQRPPAARPQGRPPEPPPGRPPSAPARPQQGPPPHAQAPAAVVDGRPDPGQGKPPKE